MHYIQHRYYTWNGWMHYARYDSRDEAQEALVKLHKLLKLKPSSCDGVNYNSPCGGYSYRLQ